MEIGEKLEMVLARAMFPLSVNGILSGGDGKRSTPGVVKMVTLPALSGSNSVSGPFGHETSVEFQPQYAIIGNPFSKRP